MKSNWGISIHSRHGRPCTVAFLYEEGTYRLCLYPCQVWGSCATLITRQPLPRRDDCRPNRKWMEIMTGRPDARLPSVRAHILTMPVGLQRLSAWQEKCGFLYRQLRVLWLRLLHRLQFYWMMRPLSWLTARLHHFWTDPLMGDAGGPHCWSWSEVVTILTEQRWTVVVLLEVSRRCNWKTISDRSVLQNLPLCWLQDLGGSHVHTNAHTTNDRETRRSVTWSWLLSVFTTFPSVHFTPFCQKSTIFLIIYHIFH